MLGPLVAKSCRGAASAYNRCTASPRHVLLEAFSEQNAINCKPLSKDLFEMIEDSVDPHHPNRASMSASQPTLQDKISYTLRKSLRPFRARAAGCGNMYARAQDADIRGRTWGFR